MKILIFFTIWFEIDLCDNNNNNKVYERELLK